MTAGLNTRATVVGGVIALLGIALAGSPALEERDAVVTVNPGETHQTMRGWEVTARLWETNKQEDRYDGSWHAQRTSY